MRSKLLVIVGALLALAASAAPALAGNGGFAPVPPASPSAQGIWRTWWFITVFVLVVFVLVEGLLLAFVIRYRRRKRARDVDGAQIHGSTRLEALWTVGPVLVLFAIIVFVFVELPGISNPPAATAGSPTLVVDIVGRQYYWQYRYPNGVITIDTMRAPVGRTTNLTITAPDWDVIHSWWVPALSGKRDAIPGRVNTLWFKADETGTYQGQCAELCGLDHAVMATTVEAVPAAEFDAWLATRRSEQTAGTSPLGQEEWTGACAKCHGLAGEGGVAAGAPAIVGSSVLEDPKALDELLRTGKGEMPPVGRGWTDEQFQAINSYVKERFAHGG